MKKKGNGRCVFGVSATLSILLALLVFLPVAAMATTISIGEVTVSEAETATLAIMITDVTDCGVAAVQFSYDPSVVHVTAVAGSQFDVCSPIIDNTDGDFEIAGVQFWSSGLNGNVRLANVTLQAVGTNGQWSFLNLTINELKTVGPPSQVISADVDNGKFSIMQMDYTEPVVKSPSVDFAVIPDDTDNDPRWGEVTELKVNVTDESDIHLVKVNLTRLGKDVKTMYNIGNYTANATLWLRFNHSTNATNGLTSWNGTAYVPFCLGVNATDIYGNANTSVCINLTVMKNGDVDVDGAVSYSDAMYLYKWKAGKPGFTTIHQTIAEVDGDNSVSYSDAMYLYKWKAGKPGFTDLH
jgi:hypothetical protein